MLKKLFIRVWAGPLPEWYEKYIENTNSLKKYGFDFMVWNDTKKLAELAKEKLGVTLELEDGSKKAGDVDPLYGIIFEDYIRGYDFWGHTGLDCVYGRLDRFVSDEYLSDCDIFGNDPGSICGPFSLYRNTPKVNNLFKKYPRWKEMIEDKKTWGFDEIQFAELVNQQKDLRVKYAFWQNYDDYKNLQKQDLKLLEDGTLWDNRANKETMMYHFNWLRNYPTL